MRVTSRLHVTLDQNALAHNLTLIRMLRPRNRILAMVKNQAYGHGLSLVLPALADADGFGVVTLDEALMVRQHYPDKPVLLLQGCLTQEEFRICQEHQLSMVIHDHQQCELLRQMGDQKTKVWFKVDTGMNRIGFSCDDIHAVWQQSSCWPLDVKSRVLMSHFFGSDLEDPTATLKQLEQFNSLVAELSCETSSVANSAAILKNIGCEHSWIRPGLLLYGLLPCPIADHRIQFKPAMTVRSRIVSIKQCKAKDTVGYGGVWQCPEAMPIGIVASGYATGIPLDCPRSLPVGVGDKIVHSIGKISMSLFAIDLREAPNAKVGDWVTLWGDKPLASEVSACYGADPRVLLCHGYPLLTGADAHIIP